jgi:hypothetical protein
VEAFEEELALRSGLIEPARTEEFKRQSCHEDYGPASWRCWMQK